MMITVTRDPDNQDSSRSLLCSPKPELKKLANKELIRFSGDENDEKFPQRFSEQ